MTPQGDTTRPNRVKAQFDPDFSASALAGAVLIEKAMRSLGLRRLVGEHLPERPKAAGYGTLEGVTALMAGLLAGGRGIGAAEVLRQDPLAMEIFGLEACPSSSTMYRILCDLSGLAGRSRGDWYAPSGRSTGGLDMLGGERKLPATRRIVPSGAEHGEAGRLASLASFGRAVARRCLSALPKDIVRLHGWTVLFGDATDLEVEGNCFDAARVGRDGAKALRWLTAMVGPVIAGERLMEGNRDEGGEMPSLFEEVRALVGEMAAGRVLALLDAAYFEKQVVDPLGSKPYGWDFIVCANQRRTALERIASQLPALVWSATGGDERRGWIESQAACFTHLPEGWSAPVTIIARRWREEGDLPEVWHYSFLATRLEPGGLPRALRAKGYCQAIWMLYGTKQGRETHYKTPLRDLGLHHPPSCRLGIDQAFYALASAASNVAMVLRYRVVAKTERGIELWRFRERYVRIAGYLVRSARTLTVRLSGVATGALRQTLWQEAFAQAGRL